MKNFASLFGMVACVAGALACGSASAATKAKVAPVKNVVDITAANMSEALNPTGTPADQVTFVLTCEGHRVDCHEQLEALNRTADLAKSGQINPAAKDVRFYYFDDNFKNVMELQDFCAQFEAHAAGAYICEGASWEGPTAYLYRADAKRQRHGLIKKGDDLTAVLRAFTTPAH